MSILAFVDNQDLLRMDSTLSNDLHPMSCCTHALCSWSCLPPCLPSCTLYPSWSGMLCPRSWAPHYFVSHLVSHLVLQQALSSSLFFPLFSQLGLGCCGRFLGLLLSFVSSSQESPLTRCRIPECPSIGSQWENDDRLFEFLYPMQI